ncbi:3-deoxy-D-manno-octulosonic acid transferase [Ruegeria sp. PrR005]|uniref:3-deoxy-D-manno-octulosonic acid transferase n=1 Tax=Ruegeria sp. PrR005 TaxID=2706882 RepID=A0A6B2NP00_9RHOB|nr:glycosyltransferase N-terminal domain-containing protein [Ruegeria sp. PrR005]NDW45851.1 3-deoxy-D-manno-octulosonic acid transferase [Ruegeria sp. PrR005]
MARSLSLTAYRVLSWRGAHPPGKDMPSRPEGELLWIHVADRGRFPALCDLAQRLVTLRPDLSTLFTIPGDTRTDDWPSPTGLVSVLPEDHPMSARRFLNHWTPDMCLWSGGGLKPNLIDQAAQSGLPMVLIDIAESDLAARKHRWLPDLTRTVLDCFDLIVTNGEAAARQVRRAGVAPAKVRSSPPLQVSANPAPWPEDELAAVNAALGGRPVWLSAWTQAKEFISVLTAHRFALRSLHRALLVVHVADPEEAGPLRERLEHMDLRCINWDIGDMIDDHTQVAISADPETLGLWYRVSPLTFLGSSLEPGAGGRDPLTAVALGSALLYGPNVRNHIDTYVRLASAGAARSVRDADALGSEVVHLLAPDAAAAMALAGWEVVTETAHLTDELIELVQDRLDRRGAERADA